ncbi:hypothetical protein KVQ01_11285 [Escherichia coli]|uniref:hypothetical protein n=1 Tax=Escherichia coli TaxID=562 RepID=UPI001F05FCC9|nr:hypothetical protein [Escherichia coli]MCH0685602.1 hypothetical protein [Escherichia coli]MDZ8667103.1 hypothetical protein [Escherichia coli]WRX87685.1 hypothetical protein SM938_22420 [Escherichia coli]
MIRYPCETAAIFQDVVFVIRPQSASELLSECDRAAEFFLSYFPYCELKDVRDGVIYSFGGLYLNDYEIIREAA